MEEQLLSRQQPQSLEAEQAVLGSILIESRCVADVVGIVKPEEFIDIPLLEKNVLPQKDRVQLELNGLYYSLYCYWMVHGEPDKAADAIRELMKVAYPGAFAHTKALPIAKRLGIIA